MFSIDDYLEVVDRDYDYYLFWADDFHRKYESELIVCSSLIRIQIKCAHLLMDEGQEKNYKEDGHILGEIIWNDVEKKRKAFGY